MPSPDISKLNYISEYPVDKIVYENSDSPVIISQTTGGNSTTTYTNPLGAACFITLAWSVDLVNYYPAQAVVSPTNPYTANGWVDSTSVYIYVENSSGSTQSFSIIYALDTIT